MAFWVRTLLGTSTNGPQAALGLLSQSKVLTDTLFTNYRSLDFVRSWLTKIKALEEDMWLLIFRENYVNSKLRKS